MNVDCDMECSECQRGFDECSEEEASAKWLKTFRPEDEEFFMMVKEDLLAIAGKNVIVGDGDQFDIQEIAELMADEKVFDKTYKKVPGEPNQCHYNVWKYPDYYQVASGYAVWNDDGLWRRHSWLVDSKGRTIETTVPCTLYFGDIIHRPREYADSDDCKPVVTER